MSHNVKSFKLSYILLPVLIGLSVIGWLFYQEFNPELFSDIHVSWQMCVGIFFAFLFMLGRDVGLMWRFRWMTDNVLTWRQVFRVSMLCEFTAAVTPSAVGGGGLAIWFLNREGISVAKGTALTISCLFLDEVFLIIACLIPLLVFSFDELFGNMAVLSLGVKLLFFGVYAVVIGWGLLLFASLFYRPEWVKRMLLTLFRLPGLRRWYHGAAALTDNLVLSSQEMSHKPFSFWLKAFGMTCLSWMSRYLVVNALLFAFATQGSQLLAFARQLVLWLVMKVSPTPGASGVSEYMFQVYYADYFTVAGMALVVAFIWRVVSYYMYLVIGVCIFPGWIGKRRRKEVVTIA